MTAKLFIALFVGLFVGMFILFFANFPVAWVFFVFVFVTIFGGIYVFHRAPILAGVFLFGSLLVLGIGLFGVYQLAQIKSWPTAPGAITRSWNCTRTTNGSMVYSGPCIEYTYTANGKTFAADSIDTGEFSQVWWPSPVDRFKVDRPVQVYYDPSNPGISRLSTDISSRELVTIIVGGIMTALSLFTLIWTLFGPKAAPGTAPNIHSASMRHAPEPEESEESGTPQAEQGEDLSDQLEKLAYLHERHELSDAEYEAAKRKLLGMS